MYFYTLARIYNGNLIHIMKWYSSDPDGLKQKVMFYDSDVVTISTFNENVGEFKPLWIRAPHTIDWLPARNVNLIKMVRENA